MPLVLSGLAVSGCTAHAADQVSDPPVVATAPAVRAPAVMTQDLNGEVAAILTAEIRPQIGGIIQRKAFTEGSDVRAGQLLFTIEDRLYASAHAEAKAQLEGARASGLAATAKARRFATLRETNAATIQDIDDAQTAAQQANALVHEREAALATALANIDHTRIRAPISGRIGRSQITVGSLVTPGQPESLATVQTIGRVYADLSLPLGASGYGASAQSPPKVGSAVRLFVSGDRRPLTGRVIFTDAAVMPATQSTVVRVGIANSEHRLLPGMFLRGEIEAPSPIGATVIPQQAVTVGSGADGTVFVVDHHGRANRRSVLLGRTYGTRWVILSGLAPGERVVAAGGSKVLAGQVVRSQPFAVVGANP